MPSSTASRRNVYHIPATPPGPPPGPDFVDNARRAFVSGAMRGWTTTRSSTTTSSDSAISSASPSSSFECFQTVESIGLYTLHDTIGRGNFGDVRVGYHVIAELQVAIKIIRKDRLDNELLRKVYREIELLKCLNHPYIIKVYQVMETADTIYLVTELAKNGELFDTIKCRKRLPEELARRFFWQVVSAVDFCHKRGIVHRDIKAENLLLDDHDDLRLADFGFSNFFSQSDLMSTFCGSPPYAAPEVFQATMYYGPHVDIWSLGVLLYVLLAGFPPFDGRDFREIRHKVLNVPLRFPYYISMECESLVKGMLQKNPARRPTLEQVMQHSWMQQGGCEHAIRQEIEVHEAISLGVPKQKIIDSMICVGIDGSRAEEQINAASFDNVHGLYVLLAEKWKRNIMDKYRTGLVDVETLKRVAEVCANTKIPTVPAKIVSDPISQRINKTLSKRGVVLLGCEPGGYPYAYFKNELFEELNIGRHEMVDDPMTSDNADRPGACGRQGSESRSNVMMDSSEDERETSKSEQPSADSSLADRRRWRMSENSVAPDTIPSGELEKKHSALGEIASFERLPDERAEDGEHCSSCSPGERPLPKRPSLPECLKHYPTKLLNLKHSIQLEQQTGHHTEKTNFHIVKTQFRQKARADRASFQRSHACSGRQGYFPRQQQQPGFLPPPSLIEGGSFDDTDDVTISTPPSTVAR